jgi:hypothetical protein
MAKSKTMLAKKRRGPAPTGKGVQVVVRLQPDLLTELDAMIAAQPKRRPTRAHAIREIMKAAFSLLAKDRC